jgi:acyl-CoA synthetase (AMP-forming)/AMP-acid ligase II
MTALLLHNLMDAAAERFGDQSAVRHGSTSFSFTEVRDISLSLAGALHRRGVRAGDRVCVSVKARAESVALSVALGRLGAVFVPISPALPEAEKARIIERAQPVLIAGDEPVAHLSFDELVSGRASWDDAMESTDEFATHIMYFTSGTTGAPKGVELSHRTDYLRALAMTVHEPRGPFVCMFPQFHMAGWSVSNNAWASGEEVIYADGGDTEALLQALSDSHAYRIYAIPAVLRRLIDADRSRFDLSGLGSIETGTSATSLELLTDAADAFPGAKISVVYGSTEAAAVCLLTPGELFEHPGTVGRPVPGVRIRIADTGEIQEKSPFLFSRYFRDPATTERAFEDGWFKTGEVAEQDKDGYVSIVGRTHDMIRSGGESVAPVAVDAVLVTHPAVLDAAVAGVPDEHWGEVVTAFVVLHEGRTLDLADLRDHCAGRLGASSQPRRLEIVATIPRSSATGQIQRHLLVKALAGSAQLAPAG